MGVSSNVGFSRKPQKRGFKNAPNPYHTIRNDKKRMLIQTL